MVIALTITAATAFVTTVTRGAAASLLVVLAFVAGGTGAALPVRFMQPDPQLWSGMRFVGGSATPQFATTAFGKAVVAATVDPKAPQMQLPSETFAYLLSLGDYHPPLSGFYLLALALLCIALVESGAETRYAYAVLGATPVLCTVANGWTLPLQAALVYTWVLYRTSTAACPTGR